MKRLDYVKINDYYDIKSLEWKKNVYIETICGTRFLCDTEGYDDEWGKETATILVNIKEIYENHSMEYEHNYIYKEKMSLDLGAEYIRKVVLDYAGYQKD